jgi:hypothetical protein
MPDEVELDPDPRPLALASGSTVTLTIALIGPSTPRTPQVLGGSMCVISEVTGRSAKPIRRVVRHLAPTP